MSKRFAGVAMVATLIVALCGTSALGKSIPDLGGPPKATEASSSSPSAKNEMKREAKLRSDMSKLVSDAKAGKVAPRPQQFPNTSRNNLSTGAKIGIAAAIGGAIFLIIVLHALSKD